MSAHHSYGHDRQRRAYLALGRLLSAASKAGLPPINWKVSAYGVLLGAMPSARRADMAACYETWVAFLGDAVTHDADITIHGTTDVLRSAYTRDAPGGRGETEVRVSVELTDSHEKYYA